MSILNHTILFYADGPADIHRIDVRCPILTLYWYGDICHLFVELEVPLAVEFLDAHTDEHIEYLGICIIRLLDRIISVIDILFIDSPIDTFLDQWGHTFYKAVEVEVIRVCVYELVVHIHGPLRWYFPSSPRIMTSLS